MENIKEIWRPIDGFEGLYEVSNLGRVKSCDRFVNSKGGTRLHKGKVLKQAKDGGGYLQVNLCKDGKPTAVKVHRLVWEGFNGKIPEGMQVNHIDEDKTNNSLDNINLMTPKQNVNWGTGNERRSKSLSKPIIQYSINGKKLAEFDSLSDASNQLNINIGNITSTLKGKRKTAGGYKWKFKDINSKIQK